MLHILDDDIGKLSSNIVVIAVDSLGGDGFDRLLDVARLVIEGEIESQIVLQVGDFGFGAGESDDDAALQLGDLTDDGTDGARRRTH